jgi:hypothetical protein
MVQVLIFRPDGSFYYKNISGTHDLKSLNPQYNSQYICTGFYHNNYVYVFYATTINKIDKNKDFNFIADEALKLTELEGSNGNYNWIAVGEFAVAKYLDGRPIDILYKDFYDARNHHINLENKSYCIIF